MPAAPSPASKTRQREPVTWGRRLYLGMVAMIGLLATYPIYNHFRINRLERLRSDIINAGGRAPRSRGGARTASELYWRSLGGDLSRIVLRQVEFPQSARLEASTIARLRQCPELQRLAIDGHPLDEGLCRNVLSLRQLGELRIAYCELTDAHLRGIEKLEGLSSLDLHGTLISDASVSRLSQLTGLSELNLDYCDITPAGAERLSRALPQTQLRHRPWPSAAHRAASMKLFRLGAVLQIPEERERGLTVRLRRHQWRGTPEDLAAIAPIEGVELLELTSLDLEPELLDAVARLPNIELLSIHNCQFPRAELERLGRSSSLRRLMLDDVFLEHAPAEQLATLTQLRSVGFVNSRLVPGSLAIVAQLPNLEEMVFVGMRFRGVSVGELAGASTLKRLEFVRVAIGNEPVSTLAQLSSLESLTLTGIAINNTRVDELAELTQLAHLDVTNTQMTPTGITRLKAALPGCLVESGSKPIDERDARTLLRRPPPQSGTASRP